MNKYNDLIGKSKGIFTLLKIIDDKKGLFKCSICNSTHEYNLRSWYYQGRKRCGRKNTQHRLYDRYDKMIQRCYNPKNERYKYYGGRGIKVCDSWLESFNNFLRDMESTFRDGLELDRIDNNGNYEPSNCQWTTHSKNMINRREFKNNTLGFPGVRKVSNSSYVGRCQRNKKNYRTKTYPTPEQAYKALQELILTL